MVSAGIYQLSDEELKKHPKKAQEYPGVVEKRWTTDILFALLIWLMWGAMSYVGYSGMYVFCMSTWIVCIVCYACICVCFFYALYIMSI